MYCVSVDSIKKSNNKNYSSDNHHFININYNIRDKIKLSGHINITCSIIDATKCFIFITINFKI